MTTKTVSYIYHLLIKNEVAAEEAYNLAEKNLGERRKTGVGNLAELQRLCMQAKGAWREAKEAKEDFESREW